VSFLSPVYGIVVRDLLRSLRQRGRLLGGLVRPLMWLVLVGTGFNAIAQVGGGVTYQQFVYPGIIVMAQLFGAMLMAISTVYDREFGSLRLMLASPAGLGAVLTGRVLAATLTGMLQGGVVLALAPFFLPSSVRQMLAAAAALGLAALVSSVLGLTIAARLRSVENFAGVINVVLFPLLFVSGALYPAERMPPLLGFLARANPVTYQVDLMRHALNQEAQFSASLDILVLCLVGLLLFVVARVLFDPEQRFIGRPRHDSLARGEAGPG
jgi:ABC-2 type transport system permease protein